MRAPERTTSRAGRTAVRGIRRLALPVLGLPVLGLLAACSSGTGPDGDAAVVRADRLEARLEDGVHLLVQVEDLNAYPEALFQGAVVRDDRGCLRLSGSESTVLWPKGFTAEVTADRVLLRDGSGAAVGAVGERFRMGGGHVPTLHEGFGFTEEDHALAIARCPGDFWIATPGTVETTD